MKGYNMGLEKVIPASTLHIRNEDAVKGNIPLIDFLLRESKEYTEEFREKRQNRNAYDTSVLPIFSFMPALKNSSRNGIDADLFKVIEIGRHFIRDGYVMDASYTSKALNEQPGEGKNIAKISGSSGLKVLLGWIWHPLSMVKEARLLMVDGELKNPNLMFIDNSIMDFKNNTAIKGDFGGAIIRRTRPHEHKFMVLKGNGIGNSHMIITIVENIVLMTRSNENVRYSIVGEAKFW
jgi:hypothetical protein